MYFFLVCLLHISVAASLITLFGLGHGVGRDKIETAGSCTLLWVGCLWHLNAITDFLPPAPAAKLKHFPLSHNGEVQSFRPAEVTPAALTHSVRNIRCKS